MKERNALSLISKRLGASSAMVFLGSGWENTEGVILAFRFWAERKQNKSSTAGYTVEASRKSELTFGVLSDQVAGACHMGAKHTDGKQDSCKTSAASSRSLFVMRPWGLSQITRSSKISAGHSKRQTKVRPSLFGSIHTTPSYLSWRVTKA